MKILVVNVFLLCVVSCFAKDFGKDSVDNEKCKLMENTQYCRVVKCLQNCNAIKTKFLGHNKI